MAVVIPCYRVTAELGPLLRQIGPEVARIYCVDDACPDSSGSIAREAAADDPRITVLQNPQNLGVGGAVLAGVRAAVQDGMKVIVKLDGDGQMDPAEISRLIEPICLGEADYVKGNRFYRLESLRQMPRVRLLGNAGLSFLTKISSGYWNLFDPTNGYVAIHAAVAAALPFRQISQRYFFESDMLFRLNTLRAVIVEIPMEARYAGETSSLRPGRALVTFPQAHLKNFGKRLFYNYFLRDFSLASVNLVLGCACLLFGILFGLLHWMHSARAEQFASAGTVMLAALPVILGIQLVLSFISFDMASVPRDPVHRRLGRKPVPGQFPGSPQGNNPPANRYPQPAR